MCAIKVLTWKLRIQGCCSMCSTVGRAEGTLLRAAVTNCFAGSDILLGKAGAEVQMAACMLASDAPAALKGALQDDKIMCLRSSKEQLEPHNLSCCCLHTPGMMHLSDMDMCLQHRTCHAGSRGVLMSQGVKCMCVRTCQSAAQRPAHPQPRHPLLWRSAGLSWSCCHPGGV